jgi:hypothetical protein
MKNRYIQSLDDFSINYKVITNTTLSVYDTSETIYDEDIDENDIILDINNASNLILDKVLSGCIIPKAISEIEMKGFDKHYKNFICVYNTETQLKTVISVEYDIKDFNSNDNFGLKSDTKVGGEYTHPNMRYYLKILKTTYGNVGVYHYINKVGKVSGEAHKPTLIKIGNGRVNNTSEFEIC